MSDFPQFGLVPPTEEKGGRIVSGESSGKKGSTVSQTVREQLSDIDDDALEDNVDVSVTKQNISVAENKS